MFNFLPFGGENNNSLNVFGQIAKGLIGNLTNFMPSLATNVTDLGDKYIMEIDVTGFEKEEVNIVVKDSILTINAQKDIRKNYGNQQMMQFGSLTRSFNISDVKENEISFDFKDGRLILNLPKNNPKLLER